MAATPETTNQTAPAINPLAQLFLNLLEKLTSGTSKLTEAEIKNQLKELGLTWAEFQQLLQTCQRYFQTLGIEIEIDPEKDPLAFLQKAAEILREQLPLESSVISQEVGLDKSTVPLPEALKKLREELVQLTEARRKILEEIRAKLEQLGYSPSEVDRFIHRLLNLEAEKVNQVLAAQNQPPLPQPEAVALALDQKTETTVARAKLNQIVPPDRVVQIREQLREVVNPQLTLAQVVVADTMRKNLAAINPELAEKIPHEVLEKTALSIIYAHSLGLSPEEIGPAIAPSIALTLATHPEIAANLSPEESSSLIPNLVAASQEVQEVLPKIGTPPPEEIARSVKEEAAVLVQTYLGELGVPPETAKEIAQAASPALTPPGHLATQFLLVKVPGETGPTHAESLNQSPHSDQFFRLYSPTSSPQTGLAHVTLFASLPRKELEGIIQVQAPIQGIIDQMVSQGKAVPPFLNYLLTVTHWAEVVYQHPLYQATQPLVALKNRFSQNRIVRWLAARPIIKKAAKAVEKKFAEFAAKRIVARLAKKGVIMAAEKAAELLAKEGIVATLAVLLGIPTEGATILLWLGWELLKGAIKLIKGIAKKLKLDRLFNFLTAGVFRDLKNWLENNFGTLGKLAYYGLTPLFIIASIPILIGTITISSILIPVFIITFAVIFFFNLQMQKMIATVTPPLERGGEQGISQEEFPSEIKIEEVDISRCSSLPEPAHSACILTIVLNECPLLPGFSNGINENNVHQLTSQKLEKCLSSYPNNIDVNHVVDEITQSAERFETLQCVGYKWAMEPSLPCCGNARDFVDRCEHVYSPGEEEDVLTNNINNIRPGDNAVWTYGKYGHIAMVIDTETYKDAGQIVVAQAWGGSGRINFTKVDIAGVDKFIRCHQQR